MTTLRQVLVHFENQSGGVSLTQMARDLGVEPVILQEMIDYWVRKGRLRDLSTPDCPTCGCAKDCPLVVTLPHRYELVSDTTPTDANSSSCSCQLSR